GQRRERASARAKREDFPRLAGSPEGRDDAGAHEGRLARTRRAGDAEHRLASQARDRQRDVGAAPEEPVGVGLLERAQSGKRALAVREPTAAAPGKERLELAEELRRRDEPIVLALGEAAGDGALEGRREIRDLAGERRDRLVEVHERVEELVLVERAEG